MVRNLQLQHLGIVTDSSLESQMAAHFVRLYVLVC
jgi:hypothetical protein